MRILILGGHGKVALLAYPLLNQAGHTALGAIRNPAHAADVERAGGTHVLLDIESASTEEMAAAMEGVDAVVFSAGAGGGSDKACHFSKVCQPSMPGMCQSISSTW